MEAQLTEIEIRGDRRGKIAAGIGFILFVVLILYPLFLRLNPPPGQPGTAVLLALDDFGSGDDPAGPSAPAEPVEEVTEPVPPPPTPEVEPTPPPPPTPAAKPEPAEQQKEVIQTESPAEIAIRKRKAQEEARERAAEIQRKQQEADVKRRQDAAAEAAREQAAREQREREAREAAIAEAKAREEAAQRKRDADAAALKAGLGGGFGSGGGSGDDGQPGTAGRPDGVADGRGVVAGGGGRVSGGLGGRGLLSSPAVRDRIQQSGTIVIAVCVGPDGQIKSSKFAQSGSNSSNPDLIRIALNNAKTWKFKPDPTAPPSQCGTVTYNFKVQ